MKANVTNEKSLNFLKMLCAVNFNASVIFLLIVSAVSALGSTLFFEDQSDLYGPMASNLRLMLVYLCLTELSVCSFCRFKGENRGILMMGVFLLLLLVSIEFYGTINQVPVDEGYRWFFLYLGLSHIGYGQFCKARQPHFRS